MILVIILGMDRLSKRPDIRPSIARVAIARKTILPTTGPPPQKNLHILPYTHHRIMQVIFVKQDKGRDYYKMNIPHPPWQILANALLFPLS